jgi:hypothetical protein
VKNLNVLRKAVFFNKDGVLETAEGVDNFELDLPAIRERLRDLHMICFYLSLDSGASWIDSGTVFVTDWQE